MNKKIKEREKMKRKMYHRFDIYDKIWKKMAPHLSRQLEQHGGIAKDNRNFINAVIWILRTGSTWRDLPLDYGK